MTDILLTNDDGYKSIGFHPLQRELLKEHMVTSVVPSSERSWIGKSLTLGRKLKPVQVTHEGLDLFAIDATPADCVQIGIHGICKIKPKILVSGINIGLNTGHARILSSGTIGAAMEAAIAGVKSIAASLYMRPAFKKKIGLFDPKNYGVYDNAAKITAKLVRLLVDYKFDEKTDLVSINIPYEATVDTPFVITRPIKTTYGQVFEKEGDSFALKQKPIELDDCINGTDLCAIKDGKISITPINLDLYHPESLTRLNEYLEGKW